MYKRYFKRSIDLFGSIIFLFLISPILFVLTIILVFANNGSPFFFHLRPGIHGKIFRMIKFKTMNDDCDSNGKLLPDIQRLTLIGSFIRSYSLDEIPQLINVLKGDMSLIGPRPLLVSYLPLYSLEHSRRHEVRPGMTGWAAVNGRNSLSWEEKFDLDVWYVDHVTFFLDIKILYLTFKKMYKREGINATDYSVNIPFTGK